MRNDFDEDHRDHPFPLSSKSTSIISGDRDEDKENTSIGFYDPDSHHEDVGWLGNEPDDTHPLAATAKESTALADAANHPGPRFPARRCEASAVLFRNETLTKRVLPERHPKTATGVYPYAAALSATMAAPCGTVPEPMLLTALSRYAPFHRTALPPMVRISSKNCGRRE